MTDRNLLWEEFLANCKKQGLGEDLIKRVFDYLQQNQYLSQGSRAGKQIELRRILEDALGGD
jgi:SOS response regulatory protein OraA/RecX